MSSEETAKGLAASVVIEAINAAKDSPDLKVAGSNLAKSALIISQTVNHALLPLAALNFGIQKARVYFEQRFATDMQEKLKNIPPDRIIEPKSSVAGPALNAIAFVHDEPELRDLFLNLLASAMNSETSDQAHPSFIEIIKQLDAFDATVLSELVSKYQHALAEIRLKSESGGYRVFLKHLIDLKLDDNSFENLERLARSIENFERLGLFTSSYEHYLTGEDSYKWLESHEFIQNLNVAIKNDDDSKIETQKGVLEISRLGITFRKTVCNL